MRSGQVSAAVLGRWLGVTDKMVRELAGLTRHAIILSSSAVRRSRPGDKITSNEVDGADSQVEHAIVGPAGDTWRPAAVNAMGVALVQVVPASFAARLCRRGDPRAVQVICDRLGGHVGIIRRFGSTGSQRQADHRRPAINQIDADQQSRYPSRDAGKHERELLRLRTGR